MQRTIGIAVQDERAIEFKREIDRVAANPADSGRRFADRFLSNEHTRVRQMLERARISTGARLNDQPAEQIDQVGQHSHDLIVETAMRIVIDGGEGDIHLTCRAMSQLLDGFDNHICYA